MGTDEGFGWRDAVFIYPGALRDSKVALVDGRPPAEVDRPRAGGGYDRFRLAQNDEACAVYEFVSAVADTV